MTKWAYDKIAEGLAEALAIARGAAALPELSRVSLIRAAGCLPAGSVGTVVHVYSEGRAYEVEFTEPVRTVVTVQAADVRIVT